MAKNNVVRLIGLIVMIAILFAGIVGTWAVYGKDIGDNTEDIVVLKENVGKNTLNSALMQRDVSAIQKSQADMRLEQTAGFKEILKRLPE